MRIVIDCDGIIYAAASVCEERSVNVIHKSSGKVKVFKNVTEFAGRSPKKKLDGWLAAYNKENNKHFKFEDFTVEPVQKISPNADYRKIIDGMLQGILKKLNYNELGDEVEYYVGSGKVFRHELSTLLEYKANRKETLKPLLLQDCKQYLIKQHKAGVVTGIETDDMLSMLGEYGYQLWKKSQLNVDKTVVVTTDKDAKQSNGWLFNPDKDTEPKLIEGFGELFLNKKDEVDGYGRMFLYYQVLSGDSSDNYKANCFSDIAWGSKSAYKVLKDCKNDREAWAGIWNAYQMLYPEPKIVTGWRGTEIEIDALYVLQECFDMARMLRSEDDVVYVSDILRRYQLYDQTASE